ncbi:hypothetical protein SEPCBS119000_000167 [Sporothrix epigloea]|uniref:NDT80 domain-containing protein n=1 Tax=Sporothrix epigloea TaxID=1892477 RepID=A0ABP0D598_9PEZI
MADFHPMPALSVAGGTGDDPLGFGAAVHPANTDSGFSFDASDPDMVFDASLLGNATDLSLPFAPLYDFDTFSTTFEDPFPHPTAATGRRYELTPHSTDAFNKSTSPLEEELDTKLLGFGAPIKATSLVDDARQLCEPVMTAELFGMFFLAEDVYATENTGQPLELTCYRRNLWWCSGQITLPRHITHLVNRQGRHVAVLELAASISATESIEKKATEIVFIPWKIKASKAVAHSGGDAQREDAKVAGPPPNVPIELANGQELDNGCVSVPISWKRLQFKHATANNGRRKGQQQHYIVQINLLGRIQSDGDGQEGDKGDKGDRGDRGDKGDKGATEWVKVAEIQSGPVIVRGRCPGNFVSRRDVPLTGNSTVTDKRQQRQQPQLKHPSSLQPAGGPDGTSQQPQHKSSVGGLDMNSLTPRYDPFGAVSFAQTPTHLPTPQASNHPPKRPRPAKTVAPSPSISRPPAPTWSGDATSLGAKKARQPRQRPRVQTQQQVIQQQQQPHQLLLQQHLSSAAVPLSLTLSEDECSPTNWVGTGPLSNSPPLLGLGGGNGSGGVETGGGVPPSIALPASSASTAPVTAVTMPAPAAAASAAQSDSLEMDELLYEYFPLSLDDWMPPVDAIYRPHVVHHTVVPPEVKAQQMRNKTKRYFAAD